MKIDFRVSLDDELVTLAVRESMLAYKKVDQISDLAVISHHPSDDLYGISYYGAKIRVDAITHKIDDRYYLFVWVEDNTRLARFYKTDLKDKDPIKLLKMYHVIRKMSNNHRRYGQ